MFVRRTGRAKLPGLQHGLSSGDVDTIVMWYVHWAERGGSRLTCKRPGGAHGGRWMVNNRTCWACFVSQAAVGGAAELMVSREGQSCDTRDTAGVSGLCNDGKSEGACNE